MLRYKQTHGNMPTTRLSQQQALCSPPVLPTNLLIPSSSQRPKHFNISSDESDGLLVKMRLSSRGCRDRTASKQTSVPQSVVTKSPFLFPIDGSNSIDDDGRSSPSSTAYFWPPTPMFMNKAPQSLVSPLLSIMEEQSTTITSYDPHTPMPAEECASFQAYKRVSMSSISSGDTPSLSSDIECKKIFDAASWDLNAIHTPITDAASALITMMHSKTFCSRTANDVDNIISSRSAKKTTVIKASPKAVPKKAKKTFNRPLTSAGAKNATVASSPAVAFKRIPRRFIDDPTLPTLKRGMRLAMPNDRQELNTLHCFVRAELLEVFVLDIEHLQSERATPAAGHRVGIRCVHCGKLPKSERAGTSMSTFFPKSLQDIYRGVCTWQRIHFKACRHMPEEFKGMYWKFKDTDRSRGKKKHWVKSAYAMGFRNVDNDRSGVIYDPPAIDDAGMKSSEGDSQYPVTDFDPICPEVEDDEDGDDDSDSMSDCKPTMIDSFDDARYRYQDDSSDVEEFEI